jgi:[histone H3]-lysine36 N-dimethyltransferase SETMAR
MVNLKISELELGRVRAFLDQKWPLTAIQKDLKSRGLDVSIAQLSRIKCGKQRQENAPRSTVRPGPSRVLSERQINQLVSMASGPNPPTQVAMASKLQVSQKTISRELKRNGLVRLKKPRGHRISPATQQKRKRRSLPLYRKLAGDRWKKFITVDEALFHLNENGVQTEFQYLARDADRSELQVRQTQNFPKGVMVFAGISSKGPSKPIFVKPGAKINANYYINKVLKPFFKDVRTRLFPDGDFIFHQDSAPSHTANATLEFLKREKINFIPPEEWCPNSSDVAPCDFFLWGHLKSEVRKTGPTTIRQLKNSIRRCLRKIPQDMIDHALRSWPKRLRQLRDAEGGHIENLRR